MLPEDRSRSVQFSEGVDGLGTGGHSASDSSQEQYAESCGQRFLYSAQQMWFAGRDQEADLERARVTRIACLAEQGIVVAPETPWADLFDYTGVAGTADLLTLVTCEEGSATDSG